MPTPLDVLRGFLWDAGTFAIIVAYLAVSTRYIFRYAVDVRERWGRWQTYPIPDRKATREIAGLLVLIGVDLLFLWFALWWFA